MLIGLDFDNTIACYDEVFSSEAKKKRLVQNEWKGSKKELKFLLNALDNGQAIWQAMQGQVYGPYMHKAKLFPGVARFLARCKLNGHIVVIVSHKTKYGHFDETKTLLREASLDWMNSKGFFKDSHFDIKRENIFFADTQKEKVDRIKELNLDIFIDDLEEIFLHDNFPDIKKILFSNLPSKLPDVEVCANWTFIDKFCMGDVTNEEIKNLVKSIYEGTIDNVERLAGRGNSRIYKLTTNKNNAILLKDYPDLLVDPRPRLLSEVNALKLVEGLNKTPKVIAFDKLQNIALYEWIKGENFYETNNNHILQALEFIQNLQQLKGKDSWNLASEACLSAEQLFNQINLRLNRLLKVKNKVLNDFLFFTFKPLFKKAWARAQINWPSNNFKKDLPHSMQVFSPSDFGFHNTILEDDGDLKFLDFEYFGRDDPAKLMADFIWHPGMNLNNSQKTQWLKGIITIFNNDSELYIRFNSSWPLYGLRWSLIVLNEFLYDGWHKRTYANKNITQHYKIKLSSQIGKAKYICKEIQAENLKCPYV